MSLFVRTTGKGPGLVLIHGWGMNGEVWESIAQSLENYYEITIVDLPGHGRSVDVIDSYELADIAKQVSAIVPHNISLLGWSLGGLVATQMVLNNPDSYNKLVLVASAPKFVRDDTWPDGIDAGMLDGFAGDLREDYQNTLKRFITIQTLGSDNARQEQQILRERVFRHSNPQIAALEGGLKLLHDTDIRTRLAEIKIPTLLITGEYDTLFPCKAAEKTRRLINHSRLTIIKKAGHAPFLSHEDIFLKELFDFLDESNRREKINE